MKRLFLVLTLALASLSVMVATSSSATGGVSIVSDFGAGNCDPVFSGSPCFGPPNTGLHAGDMTTLSVTVEQVTPEANGTITIDWPAGALAFVSNGDASATCTPTTSSVTCTYNDFAHGDKSDSFTFTVGPNAPNSTVTASIAATTSDGSDSANATITMAPAPLTNKDQCKNGGWQSFGTFKNQGDCVSAVASSKGGPA